MECAPFFKFVISCSDNVPHPNSHRKREEARNKGFEHWHAGQKDKAFEYFASSVDVSPAMAFEVIKVCLLTVLFDESLFADRPNL